MSFWRSLQARRISCGRRWRASTERTRGRSTLRRGDPLQRPSRPSHRRRSGVGCCTRSGWHGVAIWRRSASWRSRTAGGRAGSRSCGRWRSARWRILSSRSRRCSRTKSTRRTIRARRCASARRRPRRSLRSTRKARRRRKPPRCRGTERWRWPPVTCARSLASAMRTAPTSCSASSRRARRSSRRARARRRAKRCCRRASKRSRCASLPARTRPHSSAKLPARRIAAPPFVSQSSSRHRAARRSSRRRSRSAAKRSAPRPRRARSRRAR